MSGQDHEGLPSTRLSDYSSEPLTEHENQKLRRMMAAADSASLLWAILRSVSLWIVSVLAAAAAFFAIPWPWWKH